MRTQLPHRRCRQPLLRDARRLHPLHRPAVRRAHAARRDRRRRRRPDRRRRPALPVLRAEVRQDQPARIAAGQPARPAAQGLCVDASTPSNMLAAYQDRDKRLELMDEQGVEAAILLPSLAVCVERPIRGDAALTDAVMRAFNRWLEDDWGYAYQERIFGVPLISLLDVDLACRELHRVLDARRPHDPPVRRSGRGQVSGRSALRSVLVDRQRGADPGGVPHRRRRLQRAVRRRLGREPARRGCARCRRSNGRSCTVICR